MITGIQEVKALNRLLKHYAFSRSEKLFQDEFFQTAKPIFDTPEFQSLGQYPQHNDVSRITHILSVAYLSSKIAEHWGIDRERTIRAAMLHDLFYYDWHDGDWSHRPHGLRHPRFALVNARQLCGSRLDKRTENAILRHMWPLTPVPPKYAEGYALTIADKICASFELYYTRTPARRKKMQEMIEQINETEANQG